MHLLITDLQIHQGGIDGGSNNQNQSQILGSASLGTKAGPEVDSSRNLPDSGKTGSLLLLVSHLQLQFWPLEGAGPKLQGSEGILRICGEFWDS